MATFVGRVVAEWVSDDARVMKLAEDFGFIDPQGKTWHAPAGLVTDGASIPQLLWSIAGSPFSGAYRRAAVLHDAAYRVRTDERKDCDRMFYDAMVADGVDEDTAVRFYTAVRLFGPKWEPGVARSYGLVSLTPPLDIDQVEIALDRVLDE
jgi:hypothetical protein